MQSRPGSTPNELRKRIITTEQISIADIRSAYESARGGWTGCDWTTDHGSTNLDLGGENGDDLRRYADRLESGYYDNADAAEAHAEYDRIPQPDSLDDWCQDRDDPERHAAEWKAAWVADLRSGADWLDECAGVARIAEEYAEQAMAALDSGDVERAVQLAKASSSKESDYGDDPNWGEFRKLIEQYDCQE